MEFTQEQIAQAYACKTPEELIALAKANDVELTEEEAQAFFEERGEVACVDGELADKNRTETDRAEGELADEELDNVAGGKKGCSGRNNYPFVVFPSEEAVTFIASEGELMQAYVGILIGNDTATVRIVRTWTEYRHDKKGWIDRYDVEKISGCGGFGQEHRHRFEIKG